MLLTEKRQCRECAKDFEIRERDAAFYKKIDVPPPTLCPACRLLLKQLHVNQINLFKRTCDATGAPIVSNYPQDSGFKVYSQKYWHSDAYDGTEYGCDFDFDRPFFEQYKELARVVPRPSLFTDFFHDENSNYTNAAGKNKNCYLIFDSDENRDCYYSYGINRCRDSMDCYRIQELELSYEVIDSKNCYNSAFISNSENCSDSMFLNNCIGCKNCILCSNLTQKEYHILNKPVSKEEFETFRVSIGNYPFLQKVRDHFDAFKLKFPQKFIRGFHNENVTGNYLVHCKNAFDCYDSLNLHDGAYCTQMFIRSKDCMDCDQCGLCELVYESSNLGYNAYNIRFSQNSLNELTNLTYCNYCPTCSDLFGCIGLKKKKYCILNKQYSKEEYEKLVLRIIEHMKKSEECGENFPAELSDFPYNISLAQDFAPLTKEGAIGRGYRWRDEDEKEYLPATYTIPDDIKNVDETILEAVLACESCKKNYKIIPQELEFYKKMQLPIPRKCFLCRHRERMKQRNPRTLYKRPCQNCRTEVNTTFSSEQPEIVYCEKCYLNNLA